MQIRYLQSCCCSLPGLLPTVMKSQPEITALHDQVKAITIVLDLDSAVAPSAEQSRYNNLGELNDRFWSG